jgi:hypothetical protein
MSMQHDIGIAATTLSFLSSVIKSGEPWTEYCDREQKSAFDALHRIGAAIAVPQIGQSVSVSPNFIDRFGEWRDWKGFVCFIRALPGGGMSIGVSDHWPPKSDGDCTDGFSSDDLIIATPGQ